jgi:hypothetical protein
MVTHVNDGGDNPVVDAGSEAVSLHHNVSLEESLNTIHSGVIDTPIWTKVPCLTGATRRSIRVRFRGPGSRSANDLRAVRFGEQRNRFVDRSAYRSDR